MAAILHHFTDLVSYQFAHSSETVEKCTHHMYHLKGQLLNFNVLTTLDSQYH